jgi:hypothetical protein
MIMENVFLPGWKALYPIYQKVMGLQVQRSPLPHIGLVITAL